MADSKFDIGEAVSFGWNRFKDNAVFLIVLTIGVFIVNTVANGIQSAVMQKSVLVGLIFMTLSMGVYAFTLFVYARAALTINDQGKCGFDIIGSSFDYFVQYFLAYIIFSILCFIGFFLLIIPGIFICIKLWPYLFLVFDKNMKAVDSLKESYEITTGYFWDLLLLMVVFFLINLVGAIVFVVGLLVLIEHHPLGNVDYAHGEVPLVLFHRVERNSG